MQTPDLIRRKRGNRKSKGEREGRRKKSF